MGIVNIVIGLGISVAILLWIYRYGKQRIEREVITIENVRCPEQTQRTERSIKKGVGKSEHKGSHAKSSGL